MSEKVVENKVVDFDTQLKAEREFYLRKTDKIPGSNMSLKEAKEAQAKVSAEFEEKQRERAENVRKRNDKAQDEFRKEKGIENTSTSIVVPGVNVDVKNVPMIPSEVAFSQNFDNAMPTLPPLPSDAELNKMDVPELITLAGNRKVEVKANVDTKPALIARLKGEYTDAKFESLQGKTREVLDGYAIELKLGANAEELKTSFPNAELLSAAIEKARKA